jgi:hypothetical protein
MQIMWLDHCIDKVRQSGVKYDLLVRTRPDVGIFAPMPWNNIDPHRICYMQKDNSSRADFTFTVPMDMLDAWWDNIMNVYKREDPDNEGAPDYVILNSDKVSSGRALKEVNFPAAIVRGSHSVECMRLVKSPEYKRDCERKEAAGFFDIEMFEPVPGSTQLIEVEDRRAYVEHSSNEFVAPRNAALNFQWVAPTDNFTDVPPELINENGTLKAKVRFSKNKADDFWDVPPELIDKDGTLKAKIMFSKNEAKLNQTMEEMEPVQSLSPLSNLLKCFLGTCCGIWQIVTLSRYAVTAVSTVK